MSFTVVRDGDVIQVRASIRTHTEMEALAKALSNAEQHLPAKGGRAVLNEHTLVEDEIAIVNEGGTPQ